MESHDLAAVKEIAKMTHQKASLSAPIKPTPMLLDEQILRRLALNILIFRYEAYHIEPSYVSPVVAAFISVSLIGAARDATLTPLSVLT